MSDMSFTIGDESFSQLSSGAGKYAMSCKVDAPTYKKLRFHPNGAQGNFVVNCGQEGGIIHFTVKYVGSKQAIQNEWISDCEGWAEDAQTLVTDSGEIYDNCNLVNAVQMTEVKGIGDNLAMFDAVISFTRD